MPGAPVASFIRSQSVGAALANVVLNPVIQWALNRQKVFQPFLGNDGVAVNMAVTSIILSVLVALFAARGVRHQLAAGGLSADEPALTSQLLRRTPAPAAGHRKSPAGGIRSLVARVIIGLSRIRIRCMSRWVPRCRCTGSETPTSM